MTKRQYVYDDKVCVGFIEHLADGRWRAVKAGREVGIFRSRAEALAAIDGGT
jgi:hypothetical protein